MKDAGTLLAVPASFLLWFPGRVWNQKYNWNFPPVCDILYLYKYFYKAEA